MIKRDITESEIDFMQSWHTPKCLIESLFSNFDNLARFVPGVLGKLHLYQETFYSDEPIIDFETTAKYHKLNENQIMEMRKKVGDVYNYGSRNYGKSLCTEKLDLPISILHDEDTPIIVASADGTHLKDILSPVKNALENHPIIKGWFKKAKESPTWELEARNGWNCRGVNMRIKGKDPGDQFYGKHVKKIYIEEKSMETEQVFKKRADSIHPNGAVERYSGMTNFTRLSPTGREFFDSENKDRIINLPQYIRDSWTEKVKKDRIKAFGGKNTIDYLIYVEGEVVADSMNELDMELVAKCYNQKKEIKRFEITKKNFDHFKNLIFVERPKNATRIFISLDVGDVKTTEIIIHSEVGNTYNYLYNISCYGLIQDRLEELIYFLINELDAEIVALDCGDAFGRDIANHLEKKYSKDNVVRYMGQAKIEAGFEKDEKNNIKYIKGKPQFKEELMVIWSVHILKKLLYNQRVNIPFDNRLDMQFTALSNFIFKGNRVCKCLLEDDHLFDAWKVFSIAVWVKKDFGKLKPMQTGRSVGLSTVI